jgi:hypothetical protein
VTVSWQSPKQSESRGRAKWNKAETRGWPATGEKADSVRGTRIQEWKMYRRVDPRLTPEFADDLGATIIDIGLQP